MKTNYFSAILAGMLAIAGIQSCEQKTFDPNDGEDAGKLTQCLSPTGLSATVEEYEVTFSWTAAQDADSYKLEIATDFNFTELEESFVIEPEELPYTVELEPGNYYFRVQATAEDLDPSNWAVYSSVVEVEEDTTPATDLSAAGTANCYIVSAAGKYKFKPTKGNTTDLIAGIAEVELLWETSTEDAATGLTPNSVISRVSIDDDGYIVFTTPDTFKPGNALIAAKTALTEVTDATTGETSEKQDILWSWHIWLTSETITDVTVADGLVLMDRNIGELSATARTSMLYQWGRKDPFPGTLGNGSKVAVAGTETGIKGSSGSLEWLIMNPTKLNGQVNQGEAKSCHDSWKSLDMWGATLTEKTQYDPCPAGYKVPHSLSDAVVTPANSIDKTRFAGFTEMTYANGVFSLGATASFDATGCYLLNTIDPYVASQEIQDTRVAYLWTAQRTNLRIAGLLRIANGETSVEAAYWSKSGDTSAPYQSKYNAYAVRCEKIQTTAATE